MIVLACDLGGTRLKIGLVQAGRVLAQSVEPAHSQEGLAARLPAIKAAWLRLLEGRGLGLADCTGVGLSFPSVIDVATGRTVGEFGKFPDASQIDLRAWAEKELALPLAIDNDARMALIGEWQAGAGRGVNDLVMMTLGTGLGAAAIMGGHVLRGRHGQAGILGGHLTVRYDGRSCHCGNVGCAEAEASTLFLHELMADSPDLQGSGLHNAAILDYGLIFKAAANGDRCAIALRDHSLQVWSVMAVNLIHAYDPEMLVLGGGIMASADVILPALNAYVTRHASMPLGKVTIVASELGDQAALVAAEWLVKEHLTGTRHA